ncbi:MAG: DUF1707 domain-containing protein [Streptosporangiales bacterium]
MPHGKLRASDRDRDRVVELLNVAFSEGRLPKDEYDGRLENAFSPRRPASAPHLGGHRQVSGCERLDPVGCRRAGQVDVSLDRERDAVPGPARFGQLGSAHPAQLGDGRGAHDCTRWCGRSWRRVERPRVRRDSLTMRRDRAAAAGWLGMRRVVLVVILDPDDIDSSRNPVRVR